MEFYHYASPHLYDALITHNNIFTEYRNIISDIQGNEKRQSSYVYLELLMRQADCST
jgi:hypothetical protein